MPSTAALEDHQPARRWPTSKKPSLAGYSATKGAVRLLTKAVALKDTPRVEDGNPGPSRRLGIIETPIWLGIAGVEGANDGPDLDAISSMAVPLGVKGVPGGYPPRASWPAGLRPAPLPSMANWSSYSGHQMLPR